MVRARKTAFPGGELAPGVPVEPWMTATGRDAYGTFAAWNVDGVVQRMRWIPSGVFAMGSPEGEVGRTEDEGPRHEVTLTRGFWLGESPVTQRLWSALLPLPPVARRDSERPVTHVSWSDCERYLRALNKAVPGLAARLPTEAEWERACRAGVDDATWAGALRRESDAPPAWLDAIGWFDERGGPKPVRGKAPNPWGLHDMLGNVFEWCHDAYAPYGSEARVDPCVAGADAINRGASVDSAPALRRAAFRRWNGRSFRSPSVGFRVASGGVLPGVGARAAKR